MMHYFNVQHSAEQNTSLIVLPPSGAIKQKMGSFLWGQKYQSCLLLIILCVH